MRITMISIHSSKKTMPKYHFSCCTCKSWLLRFLISRRCCGLLLPFSLNVLNELNRLQSSILPKLRTFNSAIFQSRIKRQSLNCPIFLFWALLGHNQYLGDFHRCAGAFELLLGGLCLVLAYAGLYRFRCTINQVLRFFEAQ